MLMLFCPFFAFAAETPTDSPVLMDLYDLDTLEFVYWYGALTVELKENGAQADR